MTELRWGAATDIGMVRQKNDDSYLLANPLFAVADGMGGARGGDVASATAVEALKAAWDGGTSADDLVAAVKEANRAVYEKAGSPQLRGMGTTITALALLPRTEDGTDDELVLANVGDSRGYLLRDGDLQQLTDDHNVPGELLRRGEITAKQAADHPQRNLITRNLGGSDDVEVDVWQLVPYAGDRFLLASDGLFGEVPDEEIAPVLRTEADPEAAAKKLVDMARAAGGSDNITVVVVDVVDDGGRAEAASEALAGSARTSGRARRADRDASTTEPAPVVPASADEIVARSEEPEGRSTPARQRASGWRLLTLFLVGALIGGAATAGVYWYGRASWFLGTTGDEVLIFQGRAPDGFLWIEPKVVASSGLDLEDLPPEERDLVNSNPEFTSLAEARDQLDRLERRADAFREEREPPPTTTTTTTTTAPPAPTPPPAAPAPAP